MRRWHYSNELIYRLLTGREGSTGKYWPEEVAVRTERSEVHTATTEKKNSVLTS